jgi:hypothetical protein
MSNLWEWIKKVAVPGLVVGSIFQVPATVFVSPAVAQTPESTSKNRQVDRRYNVSFESRGCQRSGGRVACDILVTNFNDTHRQVSFGAGFVDYQTRAIDSVGNVYVSSGVRFNQLRDSKEKALIDLAPGIPTRVTFNFRIPDKINELSALDLGYLTIGKIDTIGRMTISNIGNISAVSNTAQK